MRQDGSCVDSETKDAFNLPNTNSHTDICMSKKQIWKGSQEARLNILDKK